MPSSVIGNLSPFEKLYKRKPSIQHLRVLGCLCFAKVVQEKDKLMSRTKSSILMGYSEVKKGYILYDLTNQPFFVGRDIIFREDIFPFVNKACTLKPVFVDNTTKPGALYDNCESLFEIRSADTTSNNFSNRVGREEFNTDQNIGEENQPETSQVSSKIQNQVQPQLRKSCRGKHPPVWMKDFVSLNIHQNVPYALYKYISYDKISSKYQAYVSATSSITEPTSYSEAILDPKWIEAMNEEIKALENNHTWDVVTLPEDVLRKLPKYAKCIKDIVAHKRRLTEFETVALTEECTSREEKLLRVLREHKRAIGWTMSDTRGISPAFCIHKILMDKGHNPSVEK
ncbi:uncharacterized protein LOC142166259 [Nicotiana tabacum]|uniref:Uncharacterized protein LOC142166259 n=1 Tax=Nicotiana tabacum TaxID=4097 RepID=A0AC58S7Z6_TOBAC